VDELLDLGLFYDASLCVSELVTIAVLHSAGDEGELRLDVSVDADTLRVTVSGTAEVLAPTLSRSDGAEDWSLFIVDRLSHRWGVERGEETRIWFEMRARPQPAGSGPNGAEAASARNDGRLRRRSSAGDADTKLVG
jgi:hypothetical protein